MADMILKPNEKLDVREILKDIDKYEPRSTSMSREEEAGHGESLLLVSRWDLSSTKTAPSL